MIRIENDDILVKATPSQAANRHNITGKLFVERDGEVWQDVATVLYERGAWEIVPTEGAPARVDALRHQHRATRQEAIDLVIAALAA